jgi:hypothetical protein
MRMIHQLLSKQTVLRVCTDRSVNSWTCLLATKIIVVTFPCGAHCGFPTALLFYDGL